jgi:hypothetical protein
MLLNSPGEAATSHHPQIGHGLQSTSRDPIKDFADDVLKEFASSRSLHNRWLSDICADIDISVT